MSIFQDKSKRYLYISLCLLLVVIIYEQFSFGVVSTMMRLSILIPLVGGFILPLILKKIKQPVKSEKTIWYMSLSTLTIGSFLYGVFEIYGAMETLVYIYFYIAGVLAIIAIISYLFRNEVVS